MSIAAIGSGSTGLDWQSMAAAVSQNQQVAGPSGNGASGSGWGGGANPMLSSLSSVLNLSTSQIQQGLGSGQSLSQIATTQGVSQSTLLSAVQSTLQNGPFGQALSTSQLSNMATAIANNTGFPQPPGGFGAAQGSASPEGGQSSAIGGLPSDTIVTFLQNLSSGQGAGGGATGDSASGSGAGPNSLMSSLSSVLNLSTSQIQQDLGSGQSLSQIASAQGVSQNTLLNTIESSFQSGPFGQALSTSQLTNMATTIADNAGPFGQSPASGAASGLGGVGGHHHHHHHGGSSELESLLGSSGSSTSTSTSTSTSLLGGSASVGAGLLGGSTASAGAGLLPGSTASAGGGGLLGSSTSTSASSSTLLSV